MERTERHPSDTPQNRLRRNAVWILLFLVLLLPSASRAGDFDAANQAYDQGKFSAAKDGYEKLVESGSGNANVYYNLGNADFRLGSAGRAILNYERALALSPRHPEALANLKLLREQNGAKLLPLSWNGKMAGLFSEKAWTIAASVGGWLALIGFAILFLRKEADNFVPGAVAFLGICAFAVSLLSVRTIARNQALAIITAKQTDARLAPAASAGVAEALTAGSQVRVLSERGEWVYCELPGLGRGWVPQGAVERVRPGNS